MSLNFICISLVVEFQSTRRSVEILIPKCPKERPILQNGIFTEAAKTLNTLTVIMMYDGKLDERGLFGRVGFEYTTYCMKFAQ